MWGLLRESAGKRAAEARPYSRADVYHDETDHLFRKSYDVNSRQNLAQCSLLRYTREEHRKPNSRIDRQSGTRRFESIDR